MAQTHVLTNVLEAERAHEALLRIACERAKLDHCPTNSYFCALRITEHFMRADSSFTVT